MKMQIVLWLALNWYKIRVVATRGIVIAAGMILIALAALMFAMMGG